MSEWLCFHQPFSDSGHLSKKKMLLKISSSKCQPFCPELSVLITRQSRWHCSLNYDVCWPASTNINEAVISSIMSIRTAHDPQPRQQIATSIQSKYWSTTTNLQRKMGHTILWGGPLRTFNSSLRGQNGHNFIDPIFRCIFMDGKFCISIKISQKFVPKGSINNKSALVQVMAWRQTDDKLLSEPVLTQFT